MLKISCLPHITFHDEPVVLVPYSQHPFLIPDYDYLSRFRMTVVNRVDSPCSDSCETATVGDKLGRSISPVMTDQQSLAALYSSSVTAKIWSVASERLGDVCKPTNVSRDQH